MRTGHDQVARDSADGTGYEWCSGPIANFDTPDKRRTGDQLQKRDHSPVGDYSRVTHNIGMVAFSRGNADAVFKVQHPGMATSRGMVCGIGSRSASSCFRLSWGP
jgi:hypothetical protein